MENFHIQNYVQYEPDAVKNVEKGEGAWKPLDNGEWYDHPDQLTSENLLYLRDGFRSQSISGII